MSELIFAHHQELAKDLKINYQYCKFCIINVTSDNGNQELDDLTTCTNYNDFMLFRDLFYMLYITGGLSLYFKYTKIFKLSDSDDNLFYNFLVYYDKDDIAERIKEFLLHPDIKLPCLESPQTYEDLSICLDYQKLKIVFTTFISFGYNINRCYPFSTEENDMTLLIFTAKRIMSNFDDFDETYKKFCLLLSLGSDVRFGNWDKYMLTYNFTNLSCFHRYHMLELAVKDDNDIEQLDITKLKL
jgi:hypothetical protein